MDMDEEFVLDLAKGKAGNYLRFSSFVLDREVRDLMVPAEDWCIVYTSNRDSDLLDESNEHALLERLKDHLGWIGDGHDAEACRHSCWAHGYLDGLYLRVYKDGKVTGAFRVYAQAMHDMEQYPILDDEDHSRRVSEQTSLNVLDVVKTVAGRHDTTPAYEEAGDQAHYLVEDWLVENEPGELEDEGHGGYPSTESVTRAMLALGFIEDDDE